MAVISQLDKNTTFQFLIFVVFTAKIIFWAACVCFGFLCLIPVAYLPTGLFDWWDKAQHVLAFFCLTTLGIFAYQKAVGKVVSGLLVYGSLIEVIQRLTGWRSGEFADWVADGIGILTSFILINGLIHKRPIALKF